MAISNTERLNKIWEQMQQEKNTQVETEKYSTDSTLVVVSTQKLWHCDAGCDTGCKVRTTKNEVNDISNPKNRATPS